MDNTYPGDAWSRLRDWLRTELESTQACIMSGTCSIEEYHALCRSAEVMQNTINHMKLIQSGQDISPKHSPSPLRDVE